MPDVETDQRIRVGTDIDDVVAKHNEALADFIAETFGAMHHPDEYHGDLTELWGVSKEEAIERMWAFTRAGLHPTLELVEYADEAIPRLQDRFSFLGVSAQAKIIEAVKLTWLDDSAAGLFDETHFINPFEGDSRSKADVCAQIGAPILIDNTFRHCKIAVEAGMTAILFGNQPVPEDAPTERFYTGRDWLETEYVLDELAASF